MDQSRRRVVIVPDNDPAGRAHADVVAGSCIEAGLNVKLLVLPGVPDKGDTSDYLAGHGREALVTLLKNAPNRTAYHDFGLVFAKEWGDVRTRKDCIGQPLQANNLGERQFARLIKVAGVRRIKFRGLRHTCATLLLRAGEAVHVVSERLGHSDVTITLNTYAHVLPDMQRDAAARLNSILYRR